MSLRRVAIAATVAATLTTSGCFLVAAGAGAGAAVASSNRGATAQLPGSVHQLTELVGRVPLKQIVAETSDLIEQLSIEAALKLSRNNRALAAQLLGLSRQSLYVKLRRYGLGETGGGEDD